MLFKDVIFNVPSKLLLIVISLVVLWGIWFVVTGVFPIVPRKYRKTLHTYTEAGKEKKKQTTSSLDTLIEDTSKKFAKYISLDDIEHAEMEKALRIANMKQTPEEYKAYMLTFVFFFVFIAIVFLLMRAITGIKVFTIIAVGLAAIAVYTYFNNRNKLERNKEAAVAEIESELYRFVSYLRQEFRIRNGSVLSVLENYTSSNKKFQEELGRMIADAKTSNFTAAISRFDQRVNSDKLKMVTHGLISANNGDDVDIYFTMLERDLKAYDIARLHQAVKEIPRKLTVAKFLMFASVFLTFFYPIAVEIVHSFKEVFSQSGISFF